MSDSLTLNRSNCSTCHKVIHIAPGEGPDLCATCQIDKHLGDMIGASILFIKAHPGIREALDTLQIEGVPFTVLREKIEAGDTYIAERNSGLKLLTCRNVSPDGSFIVPEEMAYCYDTGECIKIRLLI